MRWGALPGLAPPGPASCPALLASRAARRCQAPVQGTGLPAPPTLPGRPRWCPFPTVKALLLSPRTWRKSLKSIISGSSAIHRVSTKDRQLSAPGGGYPLAYSQPVHKLPGATQGTPTPTVAACDRLIVSCRLSGNFVVPRTMSVPQRWSPRWTRNHRVGHMAVREPLVQARSVPVTLRFAYMEVLCVSGWLVSWWTRS